MFAKVFGRANINKIDAKLIGKPEDIIWKVEFSHTFQNQFGNLVDMYLLYWNSQTEEMISIDIPHGRQDIAQYVQERLNEKPKTTTS